MPMQVYNQALIQISDYYINRLMDSVKGKASKQNTFYAVRDCYNDFVVRKLVIKEPINVNMIWANINSRLKSKTSKVHRSWMEINSVYLNILKKRFSQALGKDFGLKETMTALTKS